MKRKYRQAAQRLSKQIGPAKHVDPLAELCIEKIELIKKSKLISKNRQMKKEQKKTNRAGKKDQRNNQREESWLKYLTYQQDQFGQRQLNKKQLISNNAQTKQTGRAQVDNKANAIQIEDAAKIEYEQNNNLQYAGRNNISDTDLQAIKEKLGISVKHNQQKVEKNEENDLKCGQEDLLPFAGRVFEQAPSQPPPKKIYEYPPTCKIAVIYEWPPPISPYRQWKNQMRQSRKLT